MTKFLLLDYLGQVQLFYLILLTLAKNSPAALIETCHLFYLQTFGLISPNYLKNLILKKELIKME